MVALAAALPAHAQDDGYTPFVISPGDVVLQMLDMASVGAQDYLIDLGSGDGRIPITAARLFGARGLGVDLDPDLVASSRRNAAQADVAGRVRFEIRDLFETDLSQASVVTMYLLPEVNLKLRPKLLSELRPGARIVSHDYDLGDWQPDASAEVAVPEKRVGPFGVSKVYMWIVPAQVAGRWVSEMGGRRWEFALEQRYQTVTVRAWVAGVPLEASEARLRGDEIGFVARGSLDGRPIEHRFNGRVDGGRIDGMVGTSEGGSGRQVEWRALRGG